VSLAILDSGTDGARSVGGRLKALITTPVVAASVVGICLPATDVELPAMLLNPLKLLAALAVPTALLAFGMSLSARGDRPPPPQRGEVVLSVIGRTLLMPVVAYALARMGLSPRPPPHHVGDSTFCVASRTERQYLRRGVPPCRGVGTRRDASEHGGVDTRHRCSGRTHKLTWDALKCDASAVPHDSLFD